MVYEKKCSECGKVIDFGGREIGRLPENAIEFNGEIFCKECVRELIEFGAGGIMEKVEKLESHMEDVQFEMGIEFEE